MIRHSDYVAPKFKDVALKCRRTVLAGSITGSGTTGDISSDEELDDNPFGL